MPFTLPNLRTRVLQVSVISREDSPWYNEGHHTLNITGISWWRLQVSEYWDLFSGLFLPIYWNPSHDFWNIYTKAQLNNLIFSSVSPPEWQRINLIQKLWFRGRHTDFYIPPPFSRHPLPQDFIFSLCNKKKWNNFGVFFI